MKARLRHYLEKTSPGFLTAIRAVRNRLVFRRRFRALQNRVKACVFPSREPFVLSGPFAGMGYLDETVWGSITPKWLGSYECELHEVVETIIARGYGTVIDVGCAEGYYAVGLARRMQASTVYAYDTDFLSRRQARRLAQLNQVAARLVVNSYCSHADIQRLGPGALLICDIEGWERLLLDPAECPALQHCDILVELHQGTEGGEITEMFLARFAPSHRIHPYSSRPRSEWVAREATARPAPISPIPPDLLPAAMDEHRHECQTWLWMEAMVRKQTPGRS